MNYTAVVAFFLIAGALILIVARGRLTEFFRLLGLSSA
jgi:hypothetical protein